MVLLSPGHPHSQWQYKFRSLPIGSSIRSRVGALPQTPPFSEIVAKLFAIPSEHSCCLGGELILKSHVTGQSANCVAQRHRKGREQAESTGEELVVVGNWETSVRKLKNPNNQTNRNVTKESKREEPRTRKKKCFL